MRNFRSTTILIGFLLLGSVLAAFAPTASAQQSTPADQGSTVSISGLKAPDSPIQPLVDLKTITGNIDITYAGTGCTSLTPIQVSISVTKQPSWAVVVVSPSDLFFKVKDGGTCAQAGAAGLQDSKPFTATVYATADAPAFQSEAVEFTATLKAVSGVTGSNGKGSTLITAGFYSILEARVDQPIVIARPQETVTFPITVTNFGNAPTKVSFEVTSSNPEKLVPNQINTVTVDTKVRNQPNSVQVSLQAITPYHNGYLNEVGSLTVDMKGAYAQDIAKTGDSAKLNVIVTTRGFYVPGPDASLVVFGLLGLAAVIGIRKFRSA